MTPSILAAASRSPFEATEPLYLDYNATTPVDPRVFAAMEPFFSAVFANPSSAHGRGGLAARAVERGREQLAAAVGGLAAGIVFTSGATEADNLALLGVWSARELHSNRRRVITVATEHKGVLAAADSLAGMGADLVILSVDRSGLIDPDELARALAEPTLLVSVGAANNETGVVPNLRGIVERAHLAGALVHSDAAQMIGKLPFSILDLNLDLVSLSAHKAYGPKGVGALYVRPGLKLEPILMGGGQEHGRRSGTVNVPGVVGFGAAAELARELVPDEAPRQAALRELLWDRLSRAVPEAVRNTPTAGILPNTLNVGLPVDADDLLTATPELEASTGSACNAGSEEPSYVLRAMGSTYDEARSAIRFSLGRPTTAREVEAAADGIARGIDRLRRSA